jgi:hypothetical protein
VTGGFGFYRQLAPDGRELTREQRTDIRARLEANAECLRIVDIELPSLDATYYRERLFPWIVVSRSVVRSLVLTLSADPALRARAMTVQELQLRAQRAGRQAGLLPEEGGE